MSADGSGPSSARMPGAKAPRIRYIPVGLTGDGTRLETDSMGAVEVPANKYWGAQTQRSMIHFLIGDDRMPTAVYHAYGHVKKAAAIVNGRAGRLPAWKAALIEQVADEVITGQLDEHFPLHVWQSGAGSQSNTNVNEVIANRAIQLAGGVLGSKVPVHPGDDVNMGQSGNDTFPTAMHIAAAQVIHERLLPSVRELQQAIAAKAALWRDIVKVGRTHLEDAVPVTVGQEWSGYAHQLAQGIDQVTDSAEGLYELAVGGTAVGTGLNAPPRFGRSVAALIAAATGYPFRTAENKFAAQGGMDAMAIASAGLRALAVPLIKIANDIRWMASGPRCGLGELILPAYEPGSSTMPGKASPNQCETMIMVCIQVLAEDSAIALAATQGNFELNAMRPVIIANFLHSAAILADACARLRQYGIEGAQLNRVQVDGSVARSLMLVAALSPVIGHEKAAAIARKASDEGITVREAAIAAGYVTGPDFDRMVSPRVMAGQDTTDEADASGAQKPLPFG